MQTQIGTLHAAQILMLILGFGLMVTGAYTPTLSREISSFVTAATVTIAGSSANLVLSLSISVVGPTSAPICPSCSLAYQELNIGDTISLTGQLLDSKTNIGVGGVTIDEYSGNTLLGSVITDANGNYGAALFYSKLLIQFQSNGVYAGGSNKLNQPVNVGSTFTFTTKYAAVSPNIQSQQVTVKIVGGIPTTPVVQVRMEGGDGTIYTLIASSNIQTSAPLYFEVYASTGADNVQDISIQWKRTSPNPQSDFVITKATRNQPYDKFVGSPNAANSWYTGLHPDIGVYEIHVRVTPIVGAQFTVISIIGYFGISIPYPDQSDYWLGLGIMLVGAMVAISGAFLPTGRRLP